MPAHIEHHMEIVDGPDFVQVPAPPVTGGPLTSHRVSYAQGWNAALRAVEEAEGMGLMYRCSCGFECRDDRDARDHLRGNQTRWYQEVWPHEPA
jgi:hypothetical protein